MDTREEDAGDIAVGIVGLGAVGLPLATLFARAKGVSLILLDASPARLDAIREGASPHSHFEDGFVRELSGSTLTSDPAMLRGADAVIFCLPTPLTEAREPDLSAVRAAAESAAPHLAAGTLVVLESTTWPGTTREVFGEIFGGVEDVHLAYSPERVDPGRVDPNLPGGDVLGAHVPKLVGGVTPAATERAVDLYRRVFAAVVPVASSDVAEAAKLVENIYRAVNIALVGELKIAFDAMGIDVWEVIDAASTKPFGFTRFEPGPGMGGHCLPIDPFYLSWAAKRAGAETRFVELSGEINRAMPAFVARKTAAALASRGAEVAGARILLVGVAYKRGVNIVEESPAFPLAQELTGNGALVAYCDPLVPECSLGRSVELSKGILTGFDVAVILVEQVGVDFDLIVRSEILVVDTRAVLRGPLSGEDRYFVG